jgi:hypothetical protein
VREARAVSKLEFIALDSRRRGKFFKRRGAYSPSSPGSNMTNPPTCAIASTIKTPGMIGRCGK